MNRTLVILEDEQQLLVSDVLMYDGVALWIDSKNIFLKKIVFEKKIYILYFKKTETGKYRFRSGTCLTGRFHRNISRAEYKKIMTNR